MLLRNKRTGFIYAYAKALASDPEFELYEEPKKEPVAEPPRISLKRKRVIKDANNVQSSRQ